MMSSHAHNLRAWKFFAGGCVILLTLLIIPLSTQSTTLAAPLPQGTLPPRYTPTPEPPTVTPTTPPPTTDAPTPPPPTSEGGATAIPQPTQPTILLPNTGGHAAPSSLPVFLLALIILGGGTLAACASRRERRE